MYVSWERSYLESTSIGITPGHFIWGYYISNLYVYSTYLPLFVNILFFFYCFKHFYIKTNCSTSQMFLMLSQPSVLFFSLTYLRDFTLMSLMMCLISLLIITNRNKIWYIITIVCLSLLFILRPYIGIFIIFSLILSTSRLSKFKLYSLFPILFISLGLIIYFNNNLNEIYKNIVIGYESISNFGLLGFDSSNLDNFKVALTFLLNWFSYWNTYSLLDIDNLFKMIFVYDSILLLLILLGAIIKFRNKIFILDRAYRFCLFMILSSFIIGSFESGPATVLRHKLVLIPCLYYLFFRVNKVVFKSQYS